ncbi:VOC family protein [Paenibacillus sp. GCM10027627]|uniref:VOC family protein n=1 Tax=unclassified Paenibacillus TaxID=185978 RepID=UPI0036450EB6
MKKFAIGHILIKSNQLQQTVKDFEQLGFTVTYRSDPAKAHNAFIYLSDGSFLELFNPKPVKLPDKLMVGLLKLLRPLQPAMMDRLATYMKGSEGLMDYALDSVPVEKADEYLKDIIRAGAKMGKKLSMSKKMRDGSKQSWWIAPPQDVKLPFLMSSYQPPLVCHEQEFTHRNNVQRLDGMVIEVPNLEEWITTYRSILVGTQAFRQGSECEFTLGKKHKIILRQAERYRISEIRLLTSDDSWLHRDEIFSKANITLHPIED